MAGIRWWEDVGVADKHDISFTGEQYNFNRNSQWLDDDNPGWGSSYGNKEGSIVKGNSFDYSFIHGQSLMNNGYSFVSVSDEAFIKSNFSIKPYHLVDIILGEEKTTPRLNDADGVEFEIYTPDFVRKVKEICKQNGNLLMTGAYVGTELVLNNDTALINFAGKVLHFKWRTNQASKEGKVYGASPRKTGFEGDYCFNVERDGDVYGAESPDGIEPADALTTTIFRYSENNVSAGVAFNGDYGSVTLGFPFETIQNQDARDTLMRQIIQFFENAKK